MVWFSAKNGASSIELFYEENSDELVGEGHLREGYFLGCLLVQGGIESIGSPDDKDDAACTCCHTLAQPCGEVNRSTFRPMFIEQDKMVARLKLLTYKLRLLCLLLFY